MITPSVLTDELLGDVMAAGEADVLVGLPTQNHARTAGAVARAVMGAFSGPFVRQRTVLLNLDGGSSDGTPEVVRDAAAGRDLVTGQYALRTIHRISAPYHGVPDRSTALRTIFTVADLVRARTVVIVDPTASEIGVDDVARWIRAVSVTGADYVKPLVPRAPGDGPLITQIVRPLLRAAGGFQLAEPLDTQIACSGRFAVGALAADFWALPAAEVGVDAFLTVHAMTSKLRLAQVATTASGHVEADRRPGLAEVFQQVMGAVLEALARTFSAWAPVVGSQPVAIEGRTPAPPTRLAQFNIPSFIEAFRTGLDALAPLLPAVLSPALLDGLRGAAQATPTVLDDALWASTVLAFVAAAVRRTTPPHELAQMLEPLYLGRVAAVLNDPAVGSWADRLEALALAFEEHKQAFVAALRGEEDADHGKRHSADLARSA